MRGMKIVATALAFTVSAASFVASADAKDHKRIWKRLGHIDRDFERGDRRDRDWDDHRHYDWDDDGDRAAAAIFGFGVGAILGGALSGPHYYAPSYYYQPAPRVYYQPAPVVGTHGLAPWTPEWYAYCQSRYRSFNPRTGYFLGFDGEYHFCR